jgi:hypothetical protein
MDAEGGAEQRRMIVAGSREVGRGVGDRALLCGVRCGKPPVEREGVMGRSKQETALEHRRHVIDADPDSLDERREMPGVDELAVDRRLAADGVEAGAPGPGRGEGVAGERRIKASDSAGRSLKAGGQWERQAPAAGLPVVAHQDDP